MNTDTFRPTQVIRANSVIRRRPDPGTEAGKIKLAAMAICRAQQARGMVDIRDITQAGLSKAEAERLFTPAMEKARRMDPALFAAAAA